MSVAPTNAYGAAKLGAEGYARAFHVCYDVPTVVLRLFNTFGPREHHEGDCGEVIPKFLLRANAGQPLVVFGDGSQTRDFNFVEDTARAILEAGLRPEAVGHVINVGSGFETSINDLVRMVIDVVGNPDAQIVHEAPRPADIARMCADGSKARELLGATPREPAGRRAAPPRRVVRGRGRDRRRPADRGVRPQLGRRRGRRHRSSTGCGGPGGRRGRRDRAGRPDPRVQQAPRKIH